MKSHEACAAQDFDKYAIELKKIQAKYDIALKAKNDYDKKKMIGKTLHPIQFVAYRHGGKRVSYNFYADKKW